MHRFSRILAVLVAALALLALPSAGGVSASPGSAIPSPSEPTSAGRAIVGFVEGAMPAVQAGQRLAGLPVVDTAPDAGFVVVVATDLDTVRRAVDRVPGVAYVEDDVELRALVTPDDPRYSSQYGPPMMGFPGAWDATGYGSSAVVVAVLDTGLRKTHEDFEPTRIRQGYDYVSGDNDPNDRCGHGTHVSGTVAATTDNGRGVSGMSQAAVLPYKVLDLVGGLLSVTCTGSTSTIAQAIRDAADAGAEVISMSLGGGGSTTLANAVSYAWSKGVLIVAAAGNDGGNNSVDYPAAYPEVIAVGALDSNKQRASYSDGGPQLDIAAPGSSVWSTYSSSNTSYDSLSGTSMATPHVAGALALALGCAPSGTTNTSMRDALYATAEDLGAAGRDDAYGHGLARADLLVGAVCGSAPAPDPEPEPEPEPDPGTDPDPATPTILSGQSATVTLSGTGDDEHLKIEVPAGAGQLKVVVDGPGCGLLGCSFDADLYTQVSQRATDSSYACRPYTSGSDETCTHSSPQSGWWYVRVKSYTGSGEVTLTATVS